MPEVTRFEQKRAYQSVAEQLKDMIMTGELRAGDRLPNVRELGESFGVSKATVSEALRMLGAMGLIETRQGIGTYVRDRSEQMVIEAIDLYVTLSAESVYKVYEFRRIIEPPLARLAAERIRAEHLADLDAILTRMQEGPQVNAEFLQADVEFHSAIFAATGNEIATTITQAIHQLTVETWVGVGAPPSVPEKICRAHLRILEALRDGDPDAAESAMQQHLEETVADLQRYEATVLLQRMEETDNELERAHVGSAQP
jgi:GntR family transcriptional repressor for pyruvate dehydrogenase complex